jgi:hypothetical protein
LKAENPRVAQRAEIIDWLSPINFFLRQADIVSARQPGTGEWLLADSRFKKWESSSRGTLWCRGIRVCLQPLFLPLLIGKIQLVLARLSLRAPHFFCTRQLSIT